ncbi:MAG: hypothetical protein H7123_04770 [Thermoleophilia bacterium]|nr:hypothetical protein [Thermoleophilia bacterium]
MSYINLSFTNHYLHPVEGAPSAGFDFGPGRDGRVDHLSYTLMPPVGTDVVAKPLPLTESLNESSQGLHQAMLGASGIDTVVVTHDGTGHPDVVNWSSRFGENPQSSRVTQAPAEIRDLIAAATKFQPAVNEVLRSMQK